MISRSPANNKRRANRGRPQKTQGILEVKVRAEMATRQRNRTLLLWGCKIALAFSLVAGAFLGGREMVNRMFLKNPDYNLAAVEIVDDGAALSREVVLSTAGLKIGQNIFKVSLAKAREALAALPQVERVDIQRALPSKITIEITERRPVAWLAEAKTTDPSTSEKSFLIDSKGVLFKPKRQLPEYLRLPAIFGAPVENYLPGETVETPEVCAALELVLKNADANRFHLQSIDLSKRYCLIATDAMRSKLTFGLDDIGRQLDRLGAVLDYAAAQGKEIRTVNLMVERNIPAILTDPSAPDATATEDAANGEVSKPLAALAEKVPAKGGDAGSGADKKTKTPAKKKTASTTSNSAQTLKRAEPVVHRAEPLIRRAEPVN